MNIRSFIQKVFAFVIIVSLNTSVFAAIDLSSFDLTQKQVEIFRKLEAKGKHSEEWLLNLAKAMHNHNIQEQRRRDIYIPPYTQQELEETLAWARGGAFSAFADYAGYRFDGESYRADCPNVGLFRFGRASGTEFIPVDVMRDASNTAFQLQQLLIKDKAGFPQAFIELAREYKMDKYLIPLEP